MTTVLFTPAGSGMAITGMKALRQDSDIRIIATDIDELSPGLHLADRGYIVPRFGDSRYFQAIENIVVDEDVDIILPALDPILEDFSTRRDRFAETGAKVLVSPPETVELTRDKWKTYTALEGALPFPDSYTDIDAVPDTYPLFIKPRRGSGSEDAYKVDSKDDLIYRNANIEDPLIQEYLPGTEYTVDCLSSEEGLIACVPRRRIETTAGISTKAEVVKEETLEDIAAEIAEQLEFTGPWFFQAKEDADGNPKITEIAARTAGTMCHGFVQPNLHSLAVRQIEGEDVAEPEVKYGKKMARYWEEAYLQNNQIQKLEKEMGDES